MPDYYDPDLGQFIKTDKRFARWTNRTRPTAFDLLCLSRTPTGHILRSYGDNRGAARPSTSLWPQILFRTRSPTLQLSAISLAAAKAV